MVPMTLNLNPNDGTTTGGEWSGPSSNPLRTASPSSVSPLLPTADPHHRRTPSLGELHQQLEQEQEAHVVCDLLVIF